MQPVHQLDLVFGALADPTRRAILARLAKGEATVSELAEPFDMALPSFMQHLRVLEDSGLVRSTKRGRVRTVQLQPHALRRAATWLDRQRELWDQRLNRLESFLERTKEDEPKPEQ